MRERFDAPQRVGAVALHVNRAPAADCTAATVPIILAQAYAHVDVAVRRVRHDQRGDALKPLDSEETFTHLRPWAPPAHVEVLASSGARGKEAKVGEQIRRRLGTHSSTSGMNATRYSNSPLRSGTCSG